jgi:crotonobetainyl-CoA:carnitine CoA-transferase CaiB-like acyl-CoA transferase
MTGPLAGLRVLDIATVVAAPLSASLLADYGADVVKVELPGAGDLARKLSPMKEGKSLWWKVTNRNKRFVTLDLRKDEGRELLLQMLPHFDVLVENFRPGTLDRWGLTREVLWRARPNLVILRTTAFGQTGPYNDRPGFARTFEAMSGLVYISGDPEGKPMHPGYPVGDAVGGLFGALGILAALWRRARDPEAPGEEIDLSLTEASLRLWEFLLIEHDQLGHVRERAGNASQYSAPTDVFRTRDGHWVSISGGPDGIFANNCKAIGRNDLPADTRFKTMKDRAQNATLLNVLFGEWMAQHTLDECLEAFVSAQAVLVPVYSVDQIFQDPQLREREAIVAVTDEDFGEVRMQGVVPKFSRGTPPVRISGGSMGVDNASVYADLLGLSAQDLARLAQQNVI